MLACSRCSVPHPARNLKLRVLPSLSQPPAIGEVSSFFAKAALPRIGLTTGCVGMDLSLLLTVYVVTVR